MDIIKISHHVVFRCYTDITVLYNVITSKKQSRKKI